MPPFFYFYPMFTNHANCFFGQVYRDCPPKILTERLYSINYEEQTKSEEKIQFESVIGRMSEDRYKFKLKS